MVSFRHESVLELVRDCPSFAADLVRLAHRAVPEFSVARAADSTLTQAVPIELRADALVVLAADKPVLGIIVEAQMQRDERKLYTWPAYATVARSRHECPCLLIVVTPDPAVAAWASGPIELGNGMFRAVVLGPDQIPIVVDPKEALSNVELTMLSALAHGKHDVETAVKIGEAALAIIKTEADRDRRSLYWGLLDQALSPEAKERIHMDISEMLFPPQIYLRTKSEMLLMILDKRGIPVRADQRERVLGCNHASVVKAWVHQIFDVTSTDELLCLLDAYEASLEAEEALL